MSRMMLRILAGICFMFVGLVMAQDKFVSPDGNDQSDGSQQTPWRTLAHGVSQMSSGTLWLEAGTHTLDGEVVVGNPLTIRSVSGAAEDTFVVGGGSERCFTLNAPATVLQGVTVTNGNAGLADGGNLYVTGAGVAVLECRVLGGKAVNGGGVFVADTALGSVISNTVVASNKALAKGGGVYLAAGMAVDSLVEDNQSGKGGGIYSSDGFIKGCQIFGNTVKNFSGITAIVSGNDEYIVHHFTEVGKHLFTPPEGVEEVEYLVVAGGGGGGCKGSTAGGGGGAGGMLTGTVAVTPLMSYDVTVGSGGTGSVAGVECIGGDGGNSRFHTLESIGGGGGQGLADKLCASGRPGGSGGGGSRWNKTNTYPGGDGTAGQGYNGGAGQGLAADPLDPTKTVYGRGGGGGGGAGGPGESTDGTTTKSGHGGPGLYSDITGVSVAYAGGGGGGHGYTSGQGGIGGGGNGGKGQTTSAQDGQPNSGGGGGGVQSGGTARSGAGGSGIVVLRYLVPENTTLEDLLWHVAQQPGGGVGRGGGINIVSGTEVRNSLIVNNNGVAQGGGIYIGDTARQGAALLDCCTIANNLGESAGGLHIEGTGDDEVWNSIIYHNSGGDVWLGGSSAERVFHSCLPNGGVDASNVSGDPRFINPAESDFRLRSGSPCIDSGALRDWMQAETVDLDGNPRMKGVGNRVDMGCYEYIQQGMLFFVE